MVKNRINIQKLNYGIIHSQVGFPDGVSIVMEQVESVMKDYLKIPKSNIHYLVGQSKVKASNIRECPEFWHKSETNQLVNRVFSFGFGGAINEKIENSIRIAKEEFKRFIESKKIDIIIVHNSSHPVNFIYSIAISRYFRDQIHMGKKTPKYLLWWHDSHLERDRYLNPPRDVKNYLLEGIPGKYVDHTIFINGLQFNIAKKYYLELDTRCDGLYEKMTANKSIIYNTATTPFDSIKELQKKQNNIRMEKMMKEFNIYNILKENRLTLSNTQFVLQHTRIVERKRIDFALRYAYELHNELKKRRKKKGMIFIISGQSGDELGNYKGELKKLNKELANKYKTDKFFLIFKEDIKTEITFEETPHLITRLGGISTYFSEIEGFGNNLLEVLAAGLIPVVYTYPVFKKDIAKYKFNVIALNEFEITPKAIDATIKILLNHSIRTRLANQNIDILKKKLSHQTIAPKLSRCIKKKRVILK